MPLRILDWDLYMMTMLGLMAQPHSSIQWLNKFDYRFVDE
jgi:hypothetical protein